VDPLDRAKALCLRILSSHARTEAQVRQRLTAAKLEGVADEAVAWLRRLGYLDDPAYARARARSMLSPGRLGPRAAERRLLAAGVTPALARVSLGEALQGGSGGQEELALCQALAERRTAGRRPADLDVRERARLARFLLGRGFSGEAVARVVGLDLEDAPG